MTNSPKEAQEMPEKVWLFRTMSGWRVTLEAPLPEFSDKSEFPYIPEAKYRRAVEALEYVEQRTHQCPEKGMHPHGYIQSTRMRGVVVDALDAIREARKK